MTNEKVKLRRPHMLDEKKSNRRELLKEYKKNKKNKKYESQLPYRYSKVVYGKDGFADAKEHKPDKFDLVDMLIERKGYRKVISGWWTGSTWYSTRIIEGDEVLRWAKTEKYRSLE